MLSPAPCAKQGIRSQDSDSAYQPPWNPDLPELTESNTEPIWHVPEGMRRCYARLSGDYNPIHVSTFLARLFGFSRAIVHGMWAAASCAARLPHPPNDKAVRYDVVVKGPNFIGSQVKLLGRVSHDAPRFDLYCERNPRPCLCGLLNAGANFPGMTSQGRTSPPCPACVRRLLAIGRAERAVSWPCCRVRADGKGVRTLTIRPPVRSGALLALEETGDLAPQVFEPG